MNFLVAHAGLLVFLFVGMVAIASSILVVAMRNPVHSALFLLLTFLCVAVLFFLRGAEFVGTVQILVYAGGVMVLFLFVVMLINVGELAESRMTTPLWKGGVTVGAMLFVILFAVVATSHFDARPAAPPVVTSSQGNSEMVAMALYREYLVPFEVVSLFLLVAMIGAIVIGKRELSAMEEETNPKFVIDRATEEQQVKEVVGA